MRAATIILTALLLVLSACRKEENPFAGLEHHSPNPPSEAIPQDNFAWLHQRIFRPVCANSGCHDGTFEPEFRSIGSAYNSLVFAPTIANDPGNTFTYRVVPGDPAMSFLHERLTVFVPNTSGMMPLETDGPDWPENQTQYINAITSWIQNGAKDMFGNTPTQGDLEPQITGFLVFPSGSTNGAFPRDEGEGVQPILVPPTTVDLWFALADDHTPVAELTYNKVKVATSIPAFATVPELPLSAGQSLTAADFGGAQVPFTHKASIDLGGYAAGTVLFVRVYVDDGAHDGPTETPDDGTGPPMVDYFTLKIAS